jgi:hemerythrin
MHTWEHTDPEIAVEHGDLYSRLERLRPILVEERRPATVHRAVNVLFRRMAEHFAKEEELAEVAAPQFCDLLRHDHFELLQMLAKLREVPPDNRERREAFYTAFLEALHRHDEEVDEPLFRMGAA